MTRVWKYASAVFAALVAGLLAVLGIQRWRSRGDLADQAEDLGRQAAERAEADAADAVEAERRAGKARIDAAQAGARQEVVDEVARNRGLAGRLRDLNRGGKG